MSPAERMSASYDRIEKIHARCDTLYIRGMFLAGVNVGLVIAYAIAKWGY